MFVFIESDSHYGAIETLVADLRHHGATVRTFAPQTGPLLFIDDDTASVRDLVDTSGLDCFIYDTDQLPLVGRGRTDAAAKVRIGDTVVGGDEIVVFAGPCSVDTEELTVEVASAVADLGASGLRGGAFKPRTSPYAFEGLGVEGLKILAKARDASGLPVVTEALDAAGAKAVGDHADAIQIGARTSQAFSLLHAAGEQGKPVVLKRGFGCTVDETLHAAEHAMAHGAAGVVFVERGIRTFEQSARFTLDLSGALRLKQLSRFPVLIDPSHAAGDVSLIEPLSRAAVAAGLDGLMVEVHADPKQALSDKHQALTIDGFGHLMNALRPVAEAVGRTVRKPPAKNANVSSHAA